MSTEAKADPVRAQFEAWRGKAWYVDVDPFVAESLEECADELQAALAQKAGAVDAQGDQVADIVARWMDKQLAADVAMAAIKSHLDHCYMQPANDYNRGWMAGANSVTERAAELVAAARAAPQPAIPKGWVSFADRWPNESAALDDPSVRTTDRVLVTNNLNGRDRMGRMSHVWLASPIKSFVRDEVVAFTDEGRKINGLTHWLDPFAQHNPESAR